jgi:hypothetical protein
MTSGQTLAYPRFGWPGLFVVSGTSSEGASWMLDEIFELFERDKKKCHPGHSGKRTLLDRVSGMLGDQERRQYDDRPDRRYDDDRVRYDRPRSDDDDRRRYADDGAGPRYADDDHHRYGVDQYERRRDDDVFEVHRRDDDDRPRYEDDRYRGADSRRPQKKRRLAELFDVD